MWRKNNKSNKNKHYDRFCFLSHFVCLDDSLYLFIEKCLDLSLKMRIRECYEMLKTLASLTAIEKPIQ